MDDRLRLDPYEVDQFRHPPKPENKSNNLVKSRPLGNCSTHTIDRRPHNNMLNGELSNHHQLLDNVQRFPTTVNSLVKMNSLINITSLTILSILLIISQVLTLNVPSETIFQPTCQAVNSPLCKIDSYLTVQPFTNTLGHQTLDAALADMYKYGYLFAKEPCRSKIQLFLCSLYAPVCVTQTILDRLLLPCRDDCEEAQQACKSDLAVFNASWPTEWDCKKFNYHSQDKLCVINNAMDTHIVTEPPPNFTPDESIYNRTHENDTICTKDLFDCRLRDQSRNMNALCIDHSLVCDGKKDCVIEGIDDEKALDEIGCEKNCTEGGLYCDGKCLDKADICNGKVDCSSGTDEQNCYDYPAGLIQLMLLIVTLYTLYSLIKCIIPKPDKKVSSEHDCKTEATLEPKFDGVHTNITETIDSVAPNPCYHNFLTQQRSPIYQELIYSIGTRSDYERVNVGGYSGASSVYGGCYGAFNPPSLVDEKVMREPPAAPPPTPLPPPTPTPLPPSSAIQSTYLTSPYDQASYPCI